MDDEITTIEEVVTAEPEVSPVIAFGRKFGMKIMTVGFVIFAAGVFLNLSTRQAPWSIAIAGVGFAAYLTGRILHAVSKKKR